MRELKGLLSEELRAHGKENDRSREQLCDDCQEAFPDCLLNPDNLKRYAGDKPQYFSSPVVLVVMLARGGRTRLLEWMADQAGFSLVRRAPEHGAPVLDAIAATGEAMRTEGAVVEEIIDAIADGRVTAEELARIRARVDADHAANERAFYICQQIHERASA